MIHNIYNFLIFGGTMLAIHIISTIPERLFIFAVIFLILYPLTKRLAVTKKRRLVSAVVAGLITLPMGLYLSGTILKSFPVIFAFIMAALFFISTRLVPAKKKRLVSAVVAGLIALLIDSTALTDIHRALFADPSVIRFDRGHFNALGIDRGHHILYAIGDGVEHIHAYNTDALNDMPRLSELETGKAETGFSFNDRMQEIYIVPRIRKGTWTDEYKQLDILDSRSLTLKKAIPIQSAQGVGGQWIEWDPHTGYIIVASESGRKDLENATLILDREKGKVVKELSLAPMNIFLHPSKPVLYLSFFQDRNSNEIISYDLKSLAIIKRATVNTRMDRMAYVESANELLVTAPARSLIYRLDGDTLAVKGQIKSSFGVRTIAVDPKRNLLLTLSLVTNVLDVIDLNTYKSVKRYYLAPWLRSIVLDGEGTAYVSCFSGLFRVSYAPMRRGT